MPTAFAADVLRRPIVLIAAWLVVLQAFLAGLAIAQAAAMQAPAAFDAGLICHGAGSGAGGVGAPVSDADKVLKLCCTFCGTVPPAMVPLDAAELAPTVSWERAQMAALPAFAVSIPRGAVRAGSSQAPPRIA